MRTRTSSILLAAIFILDVAPLALAQGAATAPPAAPAPAAPAGGKEGEKTYYTTFPGVDMTVMTAAEKKKLAERLNKEKCTCGCKDDSVAWCVNNDKDCPFAPILARLAATEVSPNYKKLQREEDLLNWPTYRNPPEDMKLQFDYLKGFDLDELSAQQRDLLLTKANAIPCDCGCNDGSLARCVNTDPTCQTSPKKIRELIDEIKKATIAH